MKWLGGMFSGAVAGHAQGKAAREAIEWQRFYAETHRLCGTYSASLGKPAEPPKRLTHCCGCGAALAWAGALHTTCSYCKTEHHA